MVTGHKSYRLDPHVCSPTFYYLRVMVIFMISCEFSNKPALKKLLRSVEKFSRNHKKNISYIHPYITYVAGTASLGNTVYKETMENKNTIGSCRLQASLHKELDFIILVYPFDKTLISNFSTEQCKQLFFGCTQTTVFVRVGQRKQSRVKMR